MRYKDRLDRIEAHVEGLPDGPTGRELLDEVDCLPPEEAERVHEELQNAVASYTPSTTAAGIWKACPTLARTYERIARRGR